MTKCKLITPVLLQLEHPMLSPVKETEFVIQGVQEYGNAMREKFFAGILLGMISTVVLASIFVAMQR